MRVVRAEQVASLAAAIAMAKSRLEYAQAQLARTATLARENDASQQSLDQAENDAASARADIRRSRGQHAARPGGPDPGGTRCRGCAGQGSGLGRRGARAAPGKDHAAGTADGTATVIVAKSAKTSTPASPSSLIAETGKQWLSFNAREDRLGGLAMGAAVEVARQGCKRRRRCRHRTRPFWGHLQRGRRNARSAITIATRCACVSIRSPMLMYSSPE